MNNTTILCTRSLPHDEKRALDLRGRRVCEGPGPSPRHPRPARPRPKPARPSTPHRPRTSRVRAPVAGRGPAGSSSARPEPIFSGRSSARRSWAGWGRASWPAGRAHFRLGVPTGGFPTRAGSPLWSGRAGSGAGAASAGAGGCTGR